MYFKLKRGTRLFLLDYYKYEVKKYEKLVKFYIIGLRNNNIKGIIIVQTIYS